LRWVDRVLQLLAGIIEAATSPFGWPFLLAGRHSQGQQEHRDHQKCPHQAYFLSSVTAGLNGPDVCRFRHGTVTIM
jgi:hypothetical protein